MRSPSSFLALLLLLAVSAAYPHASKAEGFAAGNDSISADQRPRVGLVLSGGGARGAAHVGVLKALEEHRVPIDMIAGTSFGAIVGGLYATGYSAAELEQVLNTIDWQATLSSAAPRSQRSFRRKEYDQGFLIKLKIGIKDGALKLPRGLITPNNLRLTLGDLINPVASAKSFDELAIPFRAVATDLETGSPVVLEDGNLTSAIVASMAVPALFPPVERNGQLLVDGGVSNNAPVDVVRAMGADIVIVVDISSPLLTGEDISSLTSVISQLTLLLTNQSTTTQLATLNDSDIVIRPDLSGIGAADFENALNAVPKGQEAARVQEQKLHKIALSERDWRAHLAARQAGGVDEPVIDFIRVVNETELSDELITSRLSAQPGDKLDAEKMSADLTKIYGLDLYEELTYSIVEDQGMTGVEIRARPPENGESHFQFGLALQDDFEGEANYQLAAGYLDPAINSFGGEWRVLLNLGDTMAISSEFYQPFDAAGRYYAFANVSGRQQNVNVIDNDGLFLNQVRISEATLQTGTGVNFGQWGTARIGLQRRYGRAKGRIGFPAKVSSTFDSTDFAAVFAIDTVDSVLFPRYGMSFDVEYENGLSWLGGDGRVDKLAVGSYIPKTWGRNTLGLLTQFGTSFNGTPNETNLFPLGGFLSLTAYAPGQITGNHGGTAALLYYRRIAGGPRYLAQTPIYVGATMETGNVWNRREDMSLNDLRWSSSLFVGADTPIGPLYLGGAIGDGGQASAFLFIGQLF